MSGEFIDLSIHIDVYTYEYDIYYTIAYFSICLFVVYYILCRYIDGQYEYKNMQISTMMI